jgi:hypothetical protein
MIHSVTIPAINRMGCAPGAGCCAECGSHHSLGATDNAPTVTCDDAGNCYEVTSTITYGDPAATGSPAPLQLPPLQIGSPAPAFTIAGSADGTTTKTMLYLGGAALLLYLLTPTGDSGRRRR